MRIDFFVPGIPATAGSKKAFAHAKTGKIVVVDDCKRGKTWRDSIIAAAREAYSGPPLTGPVEVQLTFFFPHPKNHFRTGKYSELLKECAPYLHAKKPDVTKLTRAVEDALTAIIWRDDAQIAVSHQRKIYTLATPGVQVTISEIE